MLQYFAQKFYHLKININPCMAFFVLSILVAAVFTKTVEAVYRAVTAGLKRNLCFSAAAGTDCRMHFALGTGSPGATKAAASVVSLLTGCPALGTATGLIGKAPFSIEFLLGSREVKLRATVTAGQGFVLIHEESSSKLVCSMVIHLSLISITIKRLRRINELDLTDPVY